MYPSSPEISKYTFHGLNIRYFFIPFLSNNFNFLWLLFRDLPKRMKIRSKFEAGTDERSNPFWTTHSLPIEIRQTFDQPGGMFVVTTGQCRPIGKPLLFAQIAGNQSRRASTSKTNSTWETCTHSLEWYIPQEKKILTVFPHPVMIALIPLGTFAFTEGNFTIFTVELNFSSDAN